MPGFLGGFGGLGAIPIFIPLPMLIPFFICGSFLVVVGCYLDFCSSLILSLRNFSRSSAAVRACTIVIFPLLAR